MTLDGETPIASGSLHLSYSKIFEESPLQGIPTDIIFTAEDLAFMAGRAWMERNFVYSKTCLRIKEVYFYGFFSDSNGQKASNCYFKCSEKSFMDLVLCS